MSDFAYFLWAIVFNHWGKIAGIILILVGWSDVLACGTVPVIDTIIINCMGCK